MRRAIRVLLFVGLIIAMLSPFQPWIESVQYGLWGDGVLNWGVWRLGVFLVFIASLVAIGVISSEVTKRRLMVAVVLVGLSLGGGIYEWWAIMALGPEVRPVQAGFVIMFLGHGLSFSALAANFFDDWLGRRFENSGASPNRTKVKDEANSSRDRPFTGNSSQTTFDKKRPKKVAVVEERRPESTSRRESRPSPPVHRGDRRGP
jgi:hypothetical protein